MDPRFFRELSDLLNENNQEISVTEPVARLYVDRDNQGKPYNIMVMSNDLPSGQYALYVGPDSVVDDNEDNID